MKGSNLELVREAKENEAIAAAEKVRTNSRLPTEPCPIDMNAVRFITVDLSKELRCPGYKWRRPKWHPPDPAPAYKWLKCNRLLARGNPGSIEIKCLNCGLTSRFRQL